MHRDLSGGLPPACEHFLTGEPDNPGMRDSATLWIMDDDGTLALPRVTMDARGEDWDNPRVELNLVHRDGRTFRLWSGEPRHQSGDSYTLGAGPLRFQCLEPFRRWRLTFDGQVQQSTTAAQMAGESGGEPVDLAFRFDAEMAAPPWLMGGMSADTARKVASEGAGVLMGGVRYEQLCRVTGEVRIGNAETCLLSGTGMRVRRQGVRNMAAAPGHCQHSALFPSGRAFGAIAFTPGPDGSQAFNEGFVMVDGQRLPARVLQAPWMARLDDRSASLVLETAAGNITIAGETLMSTFDHHLFEMADTSVLHQGVARYRWDGEETIGLIERCTLRERLVI